MHRKLSLAATAFFAIWLIAPSVVADERTQTFAAADNHWMAVPRALPRHDNVEGSRIDDDELVAMSERAFAAAMRARQEHFARLGLTVPTQAEPPMAMQGAGIESNASPQSISGSADEPFGMTLLPTDPSLSCPGFYIIRTHPGDTSEVGRFGVEILLRGPGSRTLQGGINFGGRASATYMGRGVNGFSAFSINNPRNENQVVNLGVTVGAPGRVMLERRGASEGNTMFVDRQVPAGDTSISVEVPPGFYVVSFAPTSAASTFYAVQALTSYVNRSGGGFSGGAVFGGFHDPARAVSATNSTGFAGICIAEPSDVSVRVESAPTYGSTGARGIEFSVSLNTGEIFLDSRTPERAPRTAINNAINEVAEWQGLQLVSYLDVRPGARQEVLRAYELTEEELDLLIDFTGYLIAADIRDEQKAAAAAGAFMFERDLFLAEFLVVADGRPFVILDLDSISELPGGDELVDDLLLELTEMGLSDIAQALENGRWLELTGLPEGFEIEPPSTDIPDDLAGELPDFLEDDTEVIYLGSDGDIHFILAIFDNTSIEDELRDEFGDGGDFDDQIPDVADTTEVIFLLRDGKIIAVAIDVGLADPELQVGPDDVLQWIEINEFRDSLIAPASSVLFDLCRLPDDIYQC